MDLITFRFIERMFALIVGGVAIYLGYRLFLKIPDRNGEGRITLPWDISVMLSRVGPGVFFALFGAAVVVFSLYKGIEMTERPAGTAGTGHGPVGATGDADGFRTFTWGAAPPAGESAARADARALLRRDIGILNNVAQSLRPDLPEHERTPIELAIPRIKFALMKPVWGDAAEGWGAPHAFERWLTDGERDPPPPDMAQAVEYYRYASRGPRP